MFFGNNKAPKPKALVEVADMIDFIKLAASSEGQSEILRTVAVKIEEVETRERALQKSQADSLVALSKAQDEIKARELAATEQESANSDELTRLQVKEQDLLALDARLRQRETTVTQNEQDLADRTKAFQVDRDALDETIKGHKDRADAAVASNDKSRLAYDAAKEELETRLANIDAAAKR